MHFLCYFLACCPKPCWGLTGRPWTFAIKDGTYLYRQQPSGRPTSFDATLPLGLRDFSGDDLFCLFSSFAANLLTLAWDENAIHFVGMKNGNKNCLSLRVVCILVNAFASHEVLVKRVH